eukprot:TRINITY_DN773_c0_g5_i1.p1 TRINITY_DN773_c0_g5~~TRINITY_DN773_c0_g5_i1.p1  ORF type:complete len:209 (+),score=-4.98 TRINITY_DN773_c0_g5_i1:36-629(+)
MQNFNFSRISIVFCQFGNGGTPPQCQQQHFNCQTTSIKLQQLILLHYQYLHQSKQYNKLQHHNQYQLSTNTLKTKAIQKKKHISKIIPVVALRFQHFQKYLLNNINTFYSKACLQKMNTPFLPPLFKEKFVFHKSVYGPLNDYFQVSNRILTNRTHKMSLFQTKIIQNALIGFKNIVQIVLFGAKNTILKSLNYAKV